jgi:hypothetical protein
MPVFPNSVSAIARISGQQDRHAAQHDYKYFTHNLMGKSRKQKFGKQKSKMFRLPLSVFRPAYVSIFKISDF